MDFANAASSVEQSELESAANAIVEQLEVA